MVEIDVDLRGSPFWTFAKKKVFITERSMLVPLASTDSAEWGLTAQSERDAVRFPSDERIHLLTVFKNHDHFGTWEKKNSNYIFVPCSTDIAPIVPKLAQWVIQTLFSMKIRVPSDQVASSWRGERFKIEMYFGI